VRPYAAFLHEVGLFPTCLPGPVWSGTGGRPQKTVSLARRGRDGDPRGMIVVGAHGMVKSFGGRRILDGLELEVDERARIGIIGANGSGKSTLLRILAGLEDADDGEVARRKDAVIAYLPQQVPGDERTALQTVHAARPDLEALEGELGDVAARLADPAVAQDLDLMTRVLRRQERLLDEFTAAGGPGFEGRARAHLLELGLAEQDLSTPTTQLSGGQRKLVALAECLARSPAVLLLDEPETHLDADRRAALEERIQAFPGAVVSVSHDRYLLDETVSTIAELDRGRIRLWPGNYSAYVVSRELEQRRQQQQYVTQQKEIARLEEAIKRFEQWARQVVNERHIKQARNKQRQIDRMDKIERPVLERHKIALSLRPQTRGGERIVELTDVTVAFGDDPILADVDLTVIRGERVGVVGGNGAGKTVLVKTIVGELEPTEGEVRRGSGIRVGYLAQDAELPTPERSPIDIVRLSQPMSEGEAVSRLMKFLFDYEQVRRPAKLLSGGERTRLQLLLLMLGGANFLVLDEPTNHLDLESVERLEAAIEEFDGTVIFVSHDRYFLDRIADRIVEVRDGEVRAYEGGWSYWRERTESALASAS
jgi:ATP-binding cassette subfamily F protein 3